MAAVQPEPWLRALITNKKKNNKSKCVQEAFPQMCTIPICSSFYNSVRLYVMFFFIQTVEMGGQHYSKDKFHIYLLSCNIALSKWSWVYDFLYDPFLNKVGTVPWICCNLIPSTHPSPHQPVSMAV
jgi:hypothetical protein